MKRFYAKLGIITMFAAFVGIASLSSCRKEGSTVAKIKVVDTSGVAFPGAMVRLYPTPSVADHGAIIIDDTMFADADGYATFDYTDMFNLGQAGFTVLDIEIRSGDSLYGEGIIKIVEEETTEEVVILQP